ncbi:hypothetical protein GCM10008957_23750 [Deinococcus ruber]|uniref:Uncharacterized protein n=1 Tax=Deinococcus ruber TaxID=1848197 RepID=A0A918C798_9DEIO|nr:hypothetical protein GCM10008957_23750 [Deinococcus ruber]
MMTTRPLGFKVAVAPSEANWHNASGEYDQHKQMWIGSSDVQAQYGDPPSYGGGGTTIFIYCGNQFDTAQMDTQT